MNSIATSVLVAFAVFLGALVGLNLHRVLPKSHLTKETQDVIRLGTGMLSVLASLVLGLLIATAKNAYDTTDQSFRSYAAEIALLNETLRDYGAAAATPRDTLRHYTVSLLHDVWPAKGDADRPVRAPPDCRAAGADAERDSRAEATGPEPSVAAGSRH